VPLARLALGDVVELANFAHGAVGEGEPGLQTAPVKQPHRAAALAGENQRLAQRHAGLFAAVADAAHG